MSVIFFPVLACRDYYRAIDLKYLSVYSFVWVTYGERGLPKRCERQEMPRSSHEKKKDVSGQAIMDDKACYEYHVFRTKRNLHLRYTCTATHGNPMDKLRIMQMTRCPMNENHAVFTPLSRLRHGLRIFTKKRTAKYAYFICVAHFIWLCSWRVICFFSENINSRRLSCW